VDTYLPKLRRYCIC